MNNSKANAGLMASYQATEEEIQVSDDLQAGILEENQLWEIIVLLGSPLEVLQRKYPNLTIIPLTFPYAILRLHRSQIEEVINSTDIIYAEKPNSLYYEQEPTEAKEASCIFPENASIYTGRGTLLGIIDSGIDIYHPDFINSNGTSKIVALFDQVHNTVLTNQAISESLATGSSERSLSFIGMDTSGHGTHVAGIAGGRHGIAPDAGLVIVKLASGRSIPNTAALMEGIQFCINEARLRSMPIAINISYGNTYGSHSGTSLLETYIDYVSQTYPCNLVIGSGNEGSSFGHASSRSNPSTELAIGSYETTLALQIFFPDWLKPEYTLTSPDNRVLTLPLEPGAYRLPLDNNTYVYVIVKEASPYSLLKEIYINFFPSQMGGYLTPGIYQIMADRTIDDALWLSPSAQRNQQTRFLTPDPECTLTIPSTCSRAITVGSYNPLDGIVSTFSGRGYTYYTNNIKPDLVAPGVDILSATIGGGYTLRTGTSMATPFVSGICCLYMQEGIVEGNDPYLYGEKLKARLISDARSLPGQSAIPSNSIGWGRLCYRPRSI